MYVQISCFSHAVTMLNISRCLTFVLECHMVFIVVLNDLFHCGLRLSLLCDGLVIVISCLETIVFAEYVIKDSFLEPPLIQASIFVASLICVE